MVTAAQCQRLGRLCAGPGDWLPAEVAPRWTLGSCFSQAAPDGGAKLTAAKLALSPGTPPSIHPAGRGRNFAPPPLPSPSHVSQAAPPPPRRVVLLLHLRLRPRCGSGTAPLPPPVPAPAVTHLFTPSCRSAYTVWIFSGQKQTLIKLAAWLQGDVTSRDSRTITRSPPCR